MLVKKITITTAITEVVASLKLVKQKVITSKNTFLISLKVNF